MISAAERFMETPGIDDIPIPKILSISRNSVVREMIQNDQHFIGKYYQPRKFPEYKERYGPLPEEALSRDFKARFQRELDIYSFSSRLPAEERFAPVLLKADETAKYFVTQFVSLDNYGDYFNRESNNYGTKASSLLRSISRLHQIFGRYHKELYRCTTKGRISRLKPRNKEEDYTRYLQYFRTIISRTSSRFQLYASTPAIQQKIQGSASSPKARNAVMKDFLKSVQIDLVEMVKDFIDRDWRICYQEKSHSIINTSKSLEKQEGQLDELYHAGILSIIHGDVVNPDNIFYLPDESRVVACDFAEMRVDQRAIDVAGALFNPYNMPENVANETAAIEQMGKYVEKVQDYEEVSLNPKEFIVRCLEARLRDHAIRLFAIDSGYIPAEIKYFASRLREFAIPDHEEELSAKFLEEMFIRRFTDFADHYLRAEGRADLEDMLGEPGSLLVKQLHLVEDLYTAAGVMNFSSSARRRKRIEEVLKG